MHLLLRAGFNLSINGAAGHCCPERKSDQALLIYEARKSKLLAAVTLLYFPAVM